MEYENLVKSYLLNSKAMQNLYKNSASVKSAKDIQYIKAAESDSKVFYDLLTLGGWFILDSGFIVVDKKTGEVFNPFLEESKDGKNFYDFQKELEDAYLEDEEENQTSKYFNYGK